MTYYAGVLIESVLLVLAMVQDRRNALNRNWLHWLGVITFVFSVVFFVGWEIVWRFLVE